MCEAFPVEELTLMIRAMKGRSRRPNHMCSHLNALQAMVPVDFRQGARDSHSVAKQASFNIAFGIDFQGFWKPKWSPKSDENAENRTGFWMVSGSAPGQADVAQMQIQQITYPTRCGWVARK